MREDKRMIILPLLCIFLLAYLPLQFLVATPSSTCHPHQRDALLRFINSFSINDFDFCGNASYPKTASWREDQDCCSWEGVSCDNSTSDVVGLNLACSRLQGQINSSSPLFSLPHLRSLNLAENDLLGSTIPPEIGVFTRLAYLNLSLSSISGIVPTELSHLSRLVSLDLSDNFWLEMEDHTMRMLVGNLTELEELHLSFVHMSTVTPISLRNITSSLISLVIQAGWLGGEFPEYIFRLPNLQMIDLSGNFFLTGTLPESSWSPSLDFMSLGGCYFTGAVPNSIGNLSRLTHLDLSSNNFTGEFDLGILSTLRNLQFLGLSGLSISGEDATHRFSLPKLQELYMENCNLSKFPSFLSLSKELRFLYLSGNKIQEIPPSICQMASLSRLYLSGNNLTGIIPQCLGNLTNLEYLDLSYNSLSEDANHGLSLPKLQALYMINCNLSVFPSFLSRSKELRFLKLSKNKIQEIPPSICQLASLSRLVLSGNNLMGVIPQCLGNLTNLEYLDLSYNSLSEDANHGFSLPKLQGLYMETCNLSVFPSFLSRSKELRFLGLTGNKIQEIPSWLWSHGIDTLEGLYLYDNLLRGSIPLVMCQLTSLSRLELSGNNLTGVIPQCLGNLTDLEMLDLSNNSLSGPLPPSLANCTSLSRLDVGYNSISGAPPTWLSTSSFINLSLRANNFVGQWPTDIFLRSASLYSIDLSDNKFEGPLPLPSYATQSYSVSNNHFSGNISSLICSATNLRLLDLSNNGLTGTLPHCLSNIIISFEYLNLRANEFRGIIPEIFHEGSNLGSLDLSRNQFEGLLPRSLSNCKWLEALDVGNNKLVDSFPSWLGDLPLKVISLRSNNFHGHIISEETRNFSQVRILDLSNNNFEGNISDKFISGLLEMTRDNGYGFPSRYMGPNNGTSTYYSVMIDLKGIEMEMVKINVQFTMLDLSSNRLWGEIPRSIGVLKSLKGLNFSRNGFTGKIPPSIGDLTNLESMDLSSNHLTGEIPKELVKLTFLEFLNLSGNNLTGPIPLGGHFDTFPDSSFEGNHGLCGIPLTRSCGQGHKEAQPPSEGKEDGKEEGRGWLEWKYVVLGFGSGMGIGIWLGYMVLEIGRPLWLVRMVIRLEASCRKRSKKNDTPRWDGRR